jgi:hypothetical protein
VDPAIHNSNTCKFKGPRLAVPSTADRRFPDDDLALAAIRQFMDDHGQVPTAKLWIAARLSPSEKTIRRRFGSFRTAAGLAGACPAAGVQISAHDDGDKPSSPP